MIAITTQEQLINFFNENTEPMGVLVTTKTPVKMNKRGNPFAETQIFKIQTIKANVNEKYEQVVNEVREAEGNKEEFVAEARKWGAHVNNAIIEKDGGYYMSMIEIEKVGDVVYELADGSQIQYSEFAEYMPAYKASSRTETDTKIKYRSFKLANIKGVVATAVLVYAQSQA